MSQVCLKNRVYQSSWKVESESNGDRRTCPRSSQGPDHTKVLSVLVRLSILRIHWKVLNKQDMICPNSSFFIPTYLCNPSLPLKGTLEAIARKKKGKMPPVMPPVILASITTWFSTRMIALPMGDLAITRHFWLLQLGGGCGGCTSG